jgi:hypothetical protein
MRLKPRKRLLLDSSLGFKYDGYLIPMINHIESFMPAIFSIFQSVGRMYCPVQIRSQE